MANTEIRSKMREAGLAQWRVADEIGIGEYTFVRWLRKELTAEKRERVLAAIDKLVAERDNA